MKHILFIISILLLSTLAFSQHEMEEIGIGSGKSKNTQYIGISYNGKGLLSTNKQTLRGKQKGTYLDYALTELLDSIDNNHTFVNLGKHWFNGNLIANGNYTHQARGYRSTVVNSGGFYITAGTGVVRSAEFKLDSNLIQLTTTGTLGDINITARDDISLAAGLSSASFIGLFTNKITILNDDGEIEIDDLDTDNTPTAYVGIDSTSGKITISPMSASAALGYDDYVAIITHDGDGDPTATVLDPLAAGTVVWSHSGVGTWEATLTGAFALNKCVGFYTGFATNSECAINRIDANRMGVVKDDGLDFGSSDVYQILIRVYN